jgi:hypothetical protein
VIAIAIDCYDHRVVAIATRIALQVHARNSDVADTPPAIDAHVFYGDLRRRFPEKPDRERELIVADFHVIETVDSGVPNGVSARLASANQRSG